MSASINIRPHAYAAVRKNTTMNPTGCDNATEITPSTHATNITPTINAATCLTIQFIYITSVPVAEDEMFHTRHVTVYHVEVVIVDVPGRGH